MRFFERPLIITDFETSGLEPRMHDILEFGAIKVDQDSLSEIARFDSKVQMQYPLNAQPEALAINGYTDLAWKGAPPLDEVLRSFSNFAANGVLGAWNITFEYGFLCEAYRRTGFINPMDYHRVDVPSIAWAKYPHLEKLSQNDIAALVGLGKEPEPHRAITGAEYALAILRRLRTR